MKAFKQFHFEAAHQLPDWPGLHGHSYTAEVWCEGDARDGYVLAESLFTARLEQVRQQLDHKYLNDIMPLPTSENIARWLWQALSDLPGLYRIRIMRGTVGFGVEYDREDAARELASS